MYTDKTIPDVEVSLQSDVKNGLSRNEADLRKKQYGSNRLTEKKQKGFLALFWEQLNSPLIYILFVAVAISLFLGEAGEAAIIIVVIMMNSLIGVFQEGKARKAIEALQKLTSPKALVIRNGQEMEIDGAELVPGDLVILEAGRYVPADLRLIKTINLKIEESVLTGESVPVEKEADVLIDESSSLGDRKNMAFMSTNVAYGRGLGLVVATGMQTEIGKIADLIADAGNEMTPLQKRLADIGKVLSVAAVVICLLLFIIGALQHRNLADMLLTAISLAVAAVPEGLPAIVTIVLALSVSSMVKVNTIVRRLPSVETLGAVNVVCSDKTGTLTQNRMTVKECYVDGRIRTAKELELDKHKLFLEGCILCNDAVLNKDSRIGDPTELALLDLGTLYALDKKELETEKPRVDENAFDSQRKRMTTIHRNGKSRIAYIKGAADEIISRCNKIYVYGKETALTEQMKKDAFHAIEDMASRALRVLAVAIKGKGDLKDEKNMVLVGLVGMIDPPRPEAAAAVASFKKAHVDTVMITGDHIDTAYAIARELGIADHREDCMTGSQIDSMPANEFEDQMEQIKVFARVSPEHKVRIVEALKRKEKIVAMTGDGVNDAPSLKAADIGIAMGKEGTDVARGAADLVLTDDNFATIEKAIREGRGIYENIRKTVLFLLSSNFGEIITMLVAVLAGLPTPLMASHILWVNLITDSLPALALGVDKNDGDALMRQQPRKSKDNLFANGGLSCTLCYGVVIGAISLLAFLQVPYHALSIRSIPVNLQSIEKILQLESVLVKAQTHAFTVLGMSQLIHAIGMRDVNKSVFRMKHKENMAMLGSLVFGIALQVLVTEIPYFVNLFGTTRLSLFEWVSLGLLSCTTLVIHELLLLGSDISSQKENGVLLEEAKES